jgi:hypothetical protein
MIMIFEYKNNIESDKLKKSSKISVFCNHCGLIKENCSVKNYIIITSRVRKMNDTDEITGLYLCRKCSKKLQDTNKSIVEKTNKSKDIFYSNIDNRKVHVCKDTIVKENLYKKMVTTNKEKYGEDYYNNFWKKADREKAIKSYKENRIVRNNDFLNKLEDNLKILQENILNGYIEKLDKNNKIHKEFIRRKLGLMNYQHINIFFYNTICNFVKNGTLDDDIVILKNTNVKRQSNGSVKRGWVKIKDLIIKYESQIELSYILYNKEKFISGKLKRNNRNFAYDDFRYFPDFYDTTTDINIEVKDVETYKKDKITIDRKLKSCKSIIVLNTNIPIFYKDLAKTLINEYEKTKRNG